MSEDRLRRMTALSDIDAETDDIAEPEADLAREPLEWLAEFNKGLGFYAAVIQNAAEYGMVERERWFKVMRQDLVAIAAHAVLAIEQIDIRLEGLREQGKEVGRG